MYLVVSTECTNVTDTWSDGRTYGLPTPHDGIGISRATLGVNTLWAKM